MGILQHYRVMLAALALACAGCASVPPCEHWNAYPVPPDTSGVVRLDVSCAPVNPFLVP